MGFDVVAAPVLDRRMPGASDVVGDRSFGTDPREVARLGRAQADGLGAAGMIPVMKHLPGHGAASVDSHHALPVVRGQDEDADLLPFLLNRDLPWAMTAHILYPAWDQEHPATLSARIIEQVIRGRIGFEGVLVTDDLAMHALTGTPAERARAALEAGCDIALYCAGIPARRPLCWRAALPSPGCGDAARAGAGMGRGAPRAAGWRGSRGRAGSAAGVNSVVVQLALAVVPAILAITLHEAAHGYAALALGDDTAKVAGRLSLNPLVHIDKFGTILLPGFLLISQLLTIGRVAFMFGWAKPVPVAAWKFRNPRRGMMVVAAAGPAMNFVLAWIGAALMPRPRLFYPGALGYLDAAMSQHPVIGTFLFYFILSNLVLGLFNLIPIPPLDGGRIVVGLLPLPLARVWARVEGLGIVIVLLVVFLLPAMLGDFGIRFDPFHQVLGTLLPRALSIVLRLSGHPVGTAYEQLSL